MWNIECKLTQFFFVKQHILDNDFPPPFNVHIGRFCLLVGIFVHDRLLMVVVSMATRVVVSELNIRVFQQKVL